MFLKYINNKIVISKKETSGKSGIHRGVFPYIGHAGGSKFDLFSRTPTPRYVITVSPVSIEARVVLCSVI